MVVERCPVCNGNGLVDNGFYTQTIGYWSTTDASPGTCRSCGGILVTIMSAGVLFRENKKTVEFRDNIMEQNVTYLNRLSAGAFKESGTMVNTILLRLEK